jgi:hypothetical protein
MSEQVELARPELSAWQAESLRLTAFPAGIATPQQLAAWKGWDATLGSPPANSASRERGQQILEDGEFGGGWLSLARQTVRVDWVLQAKAMPDQSTETFPSVGAFIEVLPPFRDAMARWLAGAPPLNRLAFGAVLNLPVDSRETGYRIISPLLPLRLDVANSRDFLYQINRPRLSSTAGVERLEINRLSRWMVSLLARANLRISDAQVQVFGKEAVTSACRVELDINSSGERLEALPGGAYDGLLRELVDMASEIASKGDVP